MYAIMQYWSHELAWQCSLLSCRRQAVIINIYIYIYIAHTIWFPETSRMHLWPSRRLQLAVASTYLFYRQNVVVRFDIVDCGIYSCLCRNQSMAVSRVCPEPLLVPSDSLMWLVTQSGFSSSHCRSHRLQFHKLHGPIPAPESRSTFIKSISCHLKHRFIVCIELSPC